MRWPIITIQIVMINSSWETKMDHVVDGVDKYFDRTFGELAHGKWTFCRPIHRGCVDVTQFWINPVDLF